MSARERFALLRPRAFQFCLWGTTLVLALFAHHALVLVAFAVLGMIIEAGTVSTSLLRPRANTTGKLILVEFSAYLAFALVLGSCAPRLFFHAQAIWPVCLVGCAAVLCLSISIYRLMGKYGAPV